MHWREQVSLGFRPTWRWFCHILSSSWGCYGLRQGQPISQTAQCMPFLYPLISAGQLLGPNQTALISRSWHHFSFLQEGVLGFQQSWPSRLCLQELLLCQLQSSGVPIFPPEHHRLSPLPLQLSVCGTAATHPTPSLQEPSGSRAHLLAFPVMFLVCVV